MRTLENTPVPNNWDRVIPYAFVYRGLSFPLHDFVGGLLHFYGWSLHRLTLYGVRHITCFITLCECFIGIHPQFGLWRYFFGVKMQMNDDSVWDCGGVDIQPRPGSNCYLCRR